MFAINYNFKVELSLISSDGNERILTDSVKTIHILKNYVTNIMPLFVFDLTLDVDTLNEIINNNVSFTLNVYRFNRANTSNDDVSDVICDKTVLSILLKPYNKQRYEPAQYTIDDDTESTSKSKLYSYTVECLQKNLVDNNSQILNDIYRDTNIATAIVNTVSKVYKGDAYIQQPDNNKKYINIIIPPMNLSNTIQHLDNEYGIYTNDANMFMDSDVFYLYAVGSNSIIDKKLTINIVPQTDNSNNSIYQTYYGDDDDNISITLKTTPVISKKKDVVDNSIGKKAVFNSYDENYNVVTREYELTDTDENKTRFYWNTSSEIYENYTRAQLMYFGNIGLANVDFSVINPNMSININGSTISDLNGEYKILLCDITLDTADYVTYTSAVNISYAK